MMKRVGFLVLLGLFVACKEKKMKNEPFQVLPEAARVEGDDAEQESAETTPTTVTTAQATGTCHKGDPWACAVEAAIFRETNALRKTPLALSKEGSYVARLWSIEQAGQNKISHEGFTQARVAALKAEFPSTKISFRAENVAMTQSRDDSPDKLAKTFVTMWKNSEGHRKNMLGSYRSMGVGVAREGRAFYATQIFY